MVCKGCYTNLPQGALVCEVCGKEPPTSPCPQCKKPVIEGRRFCPHCRTPINKENRPKAPAPTEILCPQCQAPLAAHRRFCNQCGLRQQGTPLPKTTTDQVSHKDEPKRSLSQKTKLKEVHTETHPNIQRPSEKKEIPSTRRAISPVPTAVSSKKQAEVTLKKSPVNKDLPPVSICPHCENSTDFGRRFCPSCHKRMVPLEPTPKKAVELPRQKSITPKTPSIEKIKTKSPTRTAVETHSPPLKKEAKIIPLPETEFLAPPKKRPPLRFCPDCFGQMEGDICDFCLDHPPLPPIPSLPVKKSVQPQKIALVTASVAGVALCMGLGQMMLVEEDTPPTDSSQVDVNLNYPSNSVQPSRPTESGEILPESPPESPTIADGTEIPQVNAEEDTEIPTEPNPEPEESPEPTETAPQVEETPPPEEPEVEIPSDSQIHPSQASGICSDSEMASIYRPILHSYGYGLEFSWEGEEYASANLNPKMAEQSFTTASYTFWDIDGNGTPELIVGTPATGGLIMELYTISNGQLTLLLRGNDRERYVLCSDGLIAHDDDNGTTLTLELRGNYLTIVEDQRKKDPYNLSDQAQIPFTPIAEYYFA